MNSSSQIRLDSMWGGMHTWVCHLGRFQHAALLCSFYIYFLCGRTSFIFPILWNCWYKFPYYFDRFIFVKIKYRLHGSLPSSSEIHPSSGFLVCRIGTPICGIGEHNLVSYLHVTLICVFLFSRHNITVSNHCDPTTWASGPQ